MHSQQEVANTIKEVAKQKKIPLKTMLSECGLGVNLISQLANGQAVTYVNIAKIADYLDVSIDYLLGRSQITCAAEDERRLNTYFYATTKPEHSSGFVYSYSFIFSTSFNLKYSFAA